MWKIYTWQVGTTILTNNETLPYNTESSQAYDPVTLLLDVYPRAVSVGVVSTPKGEISSEKTGNGKNSPNIHALFAHKAQMYILP